MLPDLNTTRSSVIGHWSSGTALTRSAVSDETGLYLIQYLPPGQYQIRAELPGFRTFTQTGITLQVTQNARVDIRLEVGELVQQVNVVGEALAADTRSTTLGATIDNRQVVNLPIDGRNILALVQLLPGVGTAETPTAVVSGRGGPTINVSGAKGVDNNGMLDGTTLIGAKHNGAQKSSFP